MASALCIHGAFTIATFNKVIAANLNVSKVAACHSGSHS